MRHKLIAIGATGILILLVIGAIVQVPPVLAGFTPTPTATAAATATATATPTATATAMPTATATAVSPSPPTATATSPTVAPTATEAPLLPDTGREADGPGNAPNIVVPMVGVLLLLHAAINLVARKSTGTRSG